MRKLRIDLSNKLTDYGVELLYRKLFDKNTEYNKAFFTSLEDIRKLRLYHSEGYVEPYKEECAVVDYEYIQFNYYYENLNDYTITKLVLEDEIDKILNIENQYISVNDPESYDSNVTCVMCRFVVSRNDNRPNSMNSDRRWIPVTVTDEGVKYIYEAWANLRNEKVNFFYTGNGEPNNTFENCHIMHLLDDVKVRDVQYWGRYCLLEGRKPFPYNTTTLSELGLGFYLKPHLYIRNYLATMDRNYAGDLFPIDRSYTENPNTLEYDHPVLALRLHEDDYICVWYSGKKATEEDETNFPNIAFSAKFYVNVIYGIWYDEDSIQWKDKPIQQPERRFTFSENIEFSETYTLELPPPPDPDMTPSETATVTIEEGVAVPKYSALSLDSATGLYRPITVNNSSTITSLGQIDYAFGYFDDTIGKYTIKNYSFSLKVVGNNSATNYKDVTSITLRDLSQESSSTNSYFISDQQFTNNTYEIPIQFQTSNVSNFDFANFTSYISCWIEEDSEYITFTQGIDYTLTYSTSTVNGYIEYVGVFTATSADLLSRISQNRVFGFSIQLIQKSNITYNKGTDFTTSYSYRTTSRYKYNDTNITPVAGSNFDGLLGWFVTQGYANTISANPVAIAMQEISSNDSRTIQVATAGTFNSSKIPNFTPTFIGDFTFT